MAKKISAWLIGNTGLRNPLRIFDGFSAFSHSAFVGNLHGRESEINFEKFLIKKDIIHRSINAESDGTYARKWRLMFVRYGLIYDKYNTNFKSFKGYDRTDEITPFGYIFLSADTFPAIEECFLRALTIKQVPLINDNDRFFSPFAWIITLMLALERKTGSTEMTKIEFMLYGQRTDASYDVENVIEKILDLRNRRKKASSKRVFDKKEMEKVCGLNHSYKDYCDMNMRYLRISGIIQRKGQGLKIVPAKHIIAEHLANTSIDNKSSLPASFYSLTEGASLPTDDIDIAKKALKEIEKKLKEKHVLYDISDLSLKTSAEVNTARFRLEDLLFKTDEIKYAESQKDQWQEIADYMELLIKNKTKKEYDDATIEIPKDEQAIYLEWILWRAALAIDSLTNKPYEVRGFKLDADFFPVSTAAGGRGDLYCNFKDYLILTEVTMSTSSRQESMEGEPVRRHVSDATREYKKPVYGLFIAKKVDLNTAETFRHGIWYDSGQKKRLTILPMDLENFRSCFVKMFKDGNVSSDHIVEIIKDCEKKRDCMEAPEWLDYIRTSSI